MQVFEYLRGAFPDSAGQSGSASSVAAKMGMGLIAGATGQAVAVPADLVKVMLYQLL